MASSSLQCSSAGVEMISLNLFGYKHGNLKKMLTRFYKILNWTNCLQFGFESSFTQYFTYLPYLIRTDTVLYLVSIEFNISRVGPFKNINECFVMAFKIITCNYQIIMNQDHIFNVAKVIVHHFMCHITSSLPAKRCTLNLHHRDELLHIFVVSNSLFYLYVCCKFVWEMKDGKTHF